jgi:hypothetical protein
MIDNHSGRPLFRPVAKGGRLGAERLTDQSVCHLAERIGLKAADFGAHPLRAGFLTSAARRGASVFKMRDVRCAPDQRHILKMAWLPSPCRTCCAAFIYTGSDMAMSRYITGLIRPAPTLPRGE